MLEHQLSKILDICYGWGAVLLLDEADVFLERSFPPSKLLRDNV
jgi:hypothetical protein